MRNKHELKNDFDLKCHILEVLFIFPDESVVGTEIKNEEFTIYVSRYFIPLTKFSVGFEQSGI